LLKWDTPARTPIATPSAVTADLGFCLRYQSWDGALSADGSWRIRLRRTGLYAAAERGWRPHEAALRL